MGEMTHVESSDEEARFSLRGTLWLVETAQENGDDLHCVEPVPRFTGVPMARFEPVQTALAMSKPPSMAIEAREIVESLILTCDYRTHLVGCPGDEEYVQWIPVVIAGSTLYFQTCLWSLIARLSA